jgi:hypothetical protein
VLSVCADRALILRFCLTVEHEAAIWNVIAAEGALRGYRSYKRCLRWERADGSRTRWCQDERCHWRRDGLI